MSQTNCDYTIYTDGGCAKNPGGVGAYGVVMIDNETGEFCEYSEAFPETTNNRMEVMAVIAAMEKMTPGQSAIIHSDSQYVINCWSGAWQKKKNKDLWSRMKKAGRGKKIEMVWVKGHDGDTYNERCDDLATEAMQKLLGTDTTLSASPTESLAVSSPIKQEEAVPKKAGEQKEKKKKKEEEMIPRGSGIKPSCEKAIRRLQKSHRKFRDFVDLKTGGIDSWSRKKPEYMLKAAAGAQEAYSVICETLEDEKLQVSALRWYCRGLSADDAIHKVKVDQEVAENCM